MSGDPRGKCCDAFYLIGYPSREKEWRLLFPPARMAALKVMGWFPLVLTVYQ
jgi:hypothetical protein